MFIELDFTPESFAVKRDKNSARYPQPRSTYCVSVLGYLFIYTRYIELEQEVFDEGQHLLETISTKTASGTLMSSYTRNNTSNPAQSYLQR